MHRWLLIIAIIILHHNCDDPSLQSQQILNKIGTNRFGSYRVVTEPQITKLLHLGIILIALAGYLVAL